MAQIKAFDMWNPILLLKALLRRYRNNIIYQKSSSSRPAVRCPFRFTVDVLRQTMFFIIIYMHKAQLT